MRKKRIVPGCSALSLRYWSSIGVDSMEVGLARHDVVGEAALPPEPLSQRPGLVARGVGPRAHAIDRRDPPPPRHPHVPGAGCPGTLRGRARPPPPEESPNLGGGAPPHRE